jgi:hypothetical protein
MVTTGSIYLSMHSNNDTLLSEQELKCNDELLYLIEFNNITDIDLIPCGTNLSRGRDFYDRRNR